MLEALASNDFSTPRFTHDCAFTFLKRNIVATSKPIRNPMAYSWEFADDWDSLPDDGEEEEEDLEWASPERASLELFDFLLDLKNRGALTAKAVCVIAFLSNQAGATGHVSELARRPGLQSGKYSAHVDKVTGMKPSEAEEWLYVPVPTYQRCDGSRSVQKTAVLVAHEQLAQQISSDPGITEKLESARAKGSLPKNYETHKIVASNPDVPVYPIVIYIDGIKFERHDTVVGWFVYNFVTYDRICIAALRKSALCRCGCRGWCSLFIIWSKIAWSLHAMEEGKYPDRGPLGQVFDDDADAARLALAGREFGWKAALVLLKADLAEFATSVGLPSSAHHGHPCFLCFATIRDMYDARALSPLTTPCPLKTLDTYLADCVRCEIVIKLTDPGVRHRLKAKLFLDARNDGSHGRSMITDMPELALLKGDRLEPSQEVIDTHAFELLPLPVTLVFWRVKSQQMTYHRNPIFDEDLGVSLDDTAALDWLHILALGVFQVFIGCLINTLIAVNAWKVLGGIDIRRQLSISRLQNGLFAFYSDQVKKGVEYTQVQRLDVSMFGKPGKPDCKLHGGETNGMLAYCAVLIELFKGILPSAAAWKRTCEALLRLKYLCCKEPEEFGVRDCQELRGKHRSA